MPLEINQTAACFFSSFIANCREDHRSGIPFGERICRLCTVPRSPCSPSPFEKDGPRKSEIKVVVRTCAVRRAQFPLVKSEPGCGCRPNPIWLRFLLRTGSCSIWNRCAKPSTQWVRILKRVFRLDVFKRRSTVHPGFAQERPRWYGACVLLAIQSALARHSMRWRWLV